MANRDAPVHRWAPWIAGYSKHFVADAIARYADRPSRILDPFAGVGTTLVEADLAGHEAIGFEINPYAAFVSRIKLLAHRVDTRKLSRAICEFQSFGRSAEENGATPETLPPAGFRTRAPFYSESVLRKVLLAHDYFETIPDNYVANLFRLAFASTMVGYSNYSYEPSLGRRASAGKSDVVDFPVFETIADKLLQMEADVDWQQRHRSRRDRPDGVVIGGSFLDDYETLPQSGVDLLITSPPYLNNYHYNRNTRPHLYWLGFCALPQDLKRLEDLNFGTYWQNAREADTVDLDEQAGIEEIAEAVAAIRAKNPDKGIYGGNGWANYAARYFNDCGRFVSGAKWSLRRGGTALVVIGNSILQGVDIPTDRFLAMIAERQGLEAVAIHTPRDVRVGSSIVDSRVPGSGRLYESIVELRA